MIRNMKRIIAAFLASVLLFTDCASGFAAEANMEQSETEILEETTESEFTEEMPEDVLQDTSTEEEPPQVLFEMEELREQSAKQFRLSDGSILAAQYSMDVHYESEDGEWEEIDNRFLYEAAENENDFAGYKSAEGAVEFKFAPQVQEGELVKISHDDYEVGFELLPPVEENDSETLMTALTDEVEEAEETEEMEVMQEEEPSEEQTTELFPAQISFLQGEVLNVEEVPAELAAAPAMMSLEEDLEVVWADVNSAEPGEDTELLEGTKAEDAVTSVGYGNVLPGVSLQYVLSGSSLKEYILVNEKSESYSYDFAMNLANLEPQMQEDGSILLKDAKSGETVYEIPAGYMTDAAGAYSDAVSMSIDGTGDGNWILNVTADGEWINAEERVLPVQIDPTISYSMESNTYIGGGYVTQNHPSTSYVRNTYFGVGYSREDLEIKSFVQFKNLPKLPENSVVCAAKCYFGVASYSYIRRSQMYVRAKEITGNDVWGTSYTWFNQPVVSATVLDYQILKKDTPGQYVGWNITELVKKHYLAGNSANTVSGFSLETYYIDSMDEDHWANSLLCKNVKNAYPIMQIVYRDTKGIESYYTYQTQNGGNAGAVYLSDYNGQITVVKPVASYESSIMSYDLNLVYNSVFRKSRFTGTEKDIKTKNFAAMNLGIGWKLSAQETVISVNLEDVGENGSTGSSWLVYNDSDGTEHYFRQSENNEAKYEDEDGLSLTITKNGNDFTMEDKKGNSRFFKNGYLTKITDANGNVVHIIYNEQSVEKNIPKNDGTDTITSVLIEYKDPEDSTKTIKKEIFKLSYESGYLKKIEEVYGREGNASGNYVFIGYEKREGSDCLKRISVYNGNATGTAYETARYGYTNECNEMTHVLDVESGRGLQYLYETSPTGRRVYRFLEYSQSDGVKTEGAKISVTGDSLRKTVYTDHGPDRTYGTSDDVITTCLFNSSGHTINVSSKDKEGVLLGVTASAYKEKDGSKRTNNRLTESVSTGQSGVSLLKNGGFEKQSSGSGTEKPKADNWQHHSVNGSIASKTDDPHSGDGHYNLYNGNAQGNQIISQEVTLTADKTYTASAYVKVYQNAAADSDGGVYLKILNSNGADMKLGTLLRNKTSEDIDNGWQRISVTYTPTSTGIYKICLEWRHVFGTIRVDDMQLEEGDAPSSFNNIYNCSFEEGSTGWTLSGSGLAAIKSGGERIRGNNSLRMNGFPDNAVYAEQEITLNRSLDTTFLLSGWSKGDSIAEVESVCDAATDKFWGIIIRLNYSDGTTEEQYLPFNEFIHEWQYASMAVVPKKKQNTEGNLKIESATVRVCYYNNANTAYFDNISLTEEPAQTYVYDEKGNLTSVKSTGNGSEGYRYDNTTENLLEVATAGSGTYAYEYKNAKNKYLPTKVSNDGVSMNIAYDQYGEATSTTLTDKNFSSQMFSTAKYENGLLTEQTDNTGAKTLYTYDKDRDCISVKNANQQEIKTKKEKVWGHLDTTWQKDRVSVAFGYLNGNLSTLTRGGYLDKENSADRPKYNQIYGFEYDKFGNRTAVTLKGEIRKKSDSSLISSSEEATLATYTYRNNNGPLTGMTYGPAEGALSSVAYTYDRLERVNTVKYTDVDPETNTRTETIYGYNYSADGSLAGIAVNGSPAYEYTYDSLGRLIYSAKLQNRRPVLYTSHSYDTSDRLEKQSWQIGSDSFSESYTYNQNDGTLTSMTSGGDALSYTYNSLKQLKKRSSPKLDMEYSYRSWKDVNDADGDGNKTEQFQTNQVAAISYEVKPESGSWEYRRLKYTYDQMGNITGIIEGNDIEDADDLKLAEYIYDDQNQVTQEKLLRQTSDYTYDTFGNIRSKKTTYKNGTYEQYSYTYGNASWKDQLTAIFYRDTNGVTHNGTFSYDVSGNPLTYNNGKKGWEFTWQRGRQLATAKSGNVEIINTYDVDGIRDSKTVKSLQNGTVTGSVRHDYTTLGGKIVREAYGQTVIDYFYDQDGRPYKIVVKNGNATVATGYFVLNLQGDVIAIVDDAGVVAVEYEYDAWGKEIYHDTHTDQGNILYQYNALKYRGYYYDADLGLYYLNNRFYDQEIGRFINADTVDLVLASQTTLTDKNLYAYCDNNPVVRKDAGGAIWETAFDVISLAASIAEVAADPTDVWAWAGLAGDAIDLIPVVTGAGEVVRSLKAVNKIDDISDAVRISNNTDDVLDIVGGACFVEGTLVLTSTGYVSIEDIDVGDRVWAQNPKTGENNIKKVVRTYEHETRELVHVKIEGEDIVTTPEHPFYVAMKGWVNAIQLRPGDILVQQNGENITVKFIRRELLEFPVTVYNFEVEDFHTYYVGVNAVLVHNVCKSSLTVDVFIENLKETTNRKGIARNFESSGGYEQALRDFNAFNPLNVNDKSTKYGMGKIGTLQTGETLFVRPGSKTGGATLDITLSKRKILKIRY